MAMAIAVAMTKAMAMAMVMAMPMSAVSKRGASKGGVSETEVGHETGPQCAISDDTPAGVQVSGLRAFRKGQNKTKN